MAKRIVFFGDSLTEGTSGAAYLDLLRERAAADPALRDVELVNAGVGGDTVLNLARRLEADVVARNPDAVVIFVGVNDFTTWWVRRTWPTWDTLHLWRYFARDKGVRGGINGGISAARFADGLRVLVDQLALRAPQARVALCSPSTRGEMPHTRERRALARYAAAMRTVAGERGCAFVDLNAVFDQAIANLPPRPLGVQLATPFIKDAPDYEALAVRRGYKLTYDGVHFTACGAMLVADALWPTVRALALESVPLTEAAAGD